MHYPIPQLVALNHTSALDVQPLLSFLQEHYQGDKSQLVAWLYELADFVAPAPATPEQLAYRDQLQQLATALDTMSTHNLS